MMTSANIQMILHYVMIILSEGFYEIKAQLHPTSHGNQSRGIYYTTTFDQDISRRSRSSTELPVAFKAPDVESQNFWNYSPQGGPDRRTFFEDFKYLNYGNSNVFPNFNSFLEFMNPLFDRERSVKPRQPPPSKPSEPYKYEYPFKYHSSTEKNFLPPPKPLRASIVKLETATKPPDWQEPFRYARPVDHLKQPSNFQSQPAETLPSLFIDELGFHTDHNINFRRDSNWLPQNLPPEFSVIEPSDEVQPSVQSPLSTELDFDVRTAPKIRLQSVKNDNQSSTHSSAFTSTESITEITGNLHGESKDVVSTFTNDKPDRESKKHGEDKENSKKTLQLVLTNTDNKYNMINNNLKINKDLNNNTMSDNAVETKLDKNIKPYKMSNTIKIVTDLTLEGLQKNKKSAVNVPRYTKFLNMSNLISYELNKLKQNKRMKPRSDVEKKENESYIDGFAKDRDELSLDLKILKDTNWDGFTTESADKYPPTAADIYAETRPSVLGDENITSNNQNSDINSEAKSSDNKENIKNQTIIVETRVTKSISKLLPGENRINHRKYSQIKTGRDPRKELDIMQKIDNVEIQQSNLKVIVVPVGLEVNSTEDMAFTTDENKTNQSQEKDQTFNKTILTLGKKFYVVQGNSSGDSRTAEEVSRNYRNRRKYRPLLTSRASHNSSSDKIERTTLQTADTVDHNGELLNSTNITYAEKASDGEISAVTLKSTNNPGTSLRRKKPKRTSKSKRRRTGKRRKPSSTTEKQVTAEELTHVS